jgi:superfamily II helicase
MNKEQDVLLCVGKEEAHVELSQLDVCRDCGAQIWVSPSGREMQIEKDLKLICFDCMPDPREEEIAFAPMTLEQMEEIVNYFRTRGE